MKAPKHAVALATAVLLAVMMSGALASTMAQTTRPSPAKMPQHPEPMKGMQGMKGMMDGPHHVLAMAYHDNLVTFARALQTQVTQSKSVNPEIARPAVAEMRRSFDMMKQHHHAQMTMMTGDQSKPAMQGPMQKMETHLAALNEHLIALESEVSASSPDAEKVSEQTTQILKECARMSEMGEKGKPHQMK